MTDDNSAKLITEIAAALGAAPVRLTPLRGGCVAEVYRAEFGSGSGFGPVVAKRAGAGLAVEGWMLGVLSERGGLPVPEILHCSDCLLIMSELPDGGSLGSDSVQRHAADLVAALHNVESGQFGLERPTPLGGLTQPNDPTGDWLEFFRDRRLLWITGRAEKAGRIDRRLRSRIDKLAGRLERWIEPGARPALIHGDLWGGNVLAAGGRVTGFIDPAIYYADPEIELAFSTLFATFGPVFFDRYREHRPLADGFFEVRRDLYNLYPVLVHAHLFGGGYAHQASAMLEKFGC